LPDAVIRIGDGKAEEEAIPLFMADDDNAAIVDPGAAVNRPGLSGGSVWWVPASG